MDIMKWGIIYLFLVVAYKVLMWCAPIWAIVSFVLYLVKDKPFDWTPVYVFFGGLLLYLLVVVFALLYQNRLEKRCKDAIGRLSRKDCKN